MTILYHHFYVQNHRIKTFQVCTIFLLANKKKGCFLRTIRSLYIQSKVTSLAIFIIGIFYTVPGNKQHWSPTISHFHKLIRFDTSLLSMGSSVIYWVLYFISDMNTMKKLSTILKLSTTLMNMEQISLQQCVQEWDVGIWQSNIGWQTMSTNVWS